MLSMIAGTFTKAQGEKHNSKEGTKVIMSQILKFKAHWWNTWNTPTNEKKKQAYVRSDYEKANIFWFWITLLKNKMNGLTYIKRELISLHFNWQ